MTLFSVEKSTEDIQEINCVIREKKDHLFVNDVQICGYTIKAG